MSCILRGAVVAHGGLPDGEKGRWGVLPFLFPSFPLKSHVGTEGTLVPIVGVSLSPVIS